MLLFTSKAELYLLLLPLDFLITGESSSCEGEKQDGESAFLPVRMLGFVPVLN